MNSSEGQLGGTSTDLKLKQAALLVVVVGTAYIAAAVVCIGVFSRLANRRATRRSKQLFDMLLCREMCWFDEHPASTLVATLLGDVKQIRHGMGETLGLCVHYALTFSAALVLCAVNSWRLAVVVVALVPLAVAIRQYCMRRAMRLSAERRQLEALAAAVVNEAIAGIRTVQSFNSQEDELRRYKLRTRQVWQKSVRREWWLAFATAGVSLQNFALGIAMWLAISAIRDGTPTVSQILVPMISILKAMGAAKFVFYYSTLVSTALQSRESIRKLLESPPVQVCSSSHRGTLQRGRIEFRNVSFAYKSRGVQALSGVSFVVEPGRALALVGPSGGGKSTILKLLMRFYEPDSGQILVDNRPISECSLEKLRQIMGVVSQEAYLFNTTIEENITFGMPSGRTPTPAEVHSAAREANAHDFIVQLPQKYHTLVGECGARLSGGQKQRVAVARAIIRQPKILLLDEATAALDSVDERLVQNAISAARARRSTIIVAHRLSSIVHCEEILVLENGRVVERGDHASLTRQAGGVYARLADKQGLSRTERANLVHTTTEEQSLSDSDQKKNAEESVIAASEQAAGSVTSLTHLFVLAAKGQPKLFVAGVTLCCATAACSISFGLCFGLFISSLDSAWSRSLHLHALAGIMITNIVRTVVTILMFGTFGYVAQGAVTRLGADAFEQLLHRDAAFFDDSHQATGSLLHRFTVDLQIVRNGLRAPLANVLVFIACHPLAAAVVGALEWRMLPAVVVVSLLNALGVWLVGRRAGGTERRLAAAERAVAQAFAETAALISTVRSLGCERRLRERFAKLADDSHRANSRAASVFALRFAVLQAVPLVQAVATLLVAAGVMQLSQANPADIFILLLLFAFGMHSMGSFFGDVLNARSAASSIGELYAPQTSESGRDAVDSAPTIQQPPASSGCEIAFKRVNFAYPSRPSAAVLRDLTLAVGRGQSLLIVGPSGSGKSTLLLLLQRFYEPTSGSITLDERSLSELKVSDLRDKVVAVNQQPAIFNRSLFENIAYGLTDASIKSVQRAATAAQIHDFICSLPQGYATLAGDQGCLLSGGQRQRVGLARAFVRRSSALLCLDEATSALDAATEQRVLAALVTQQAEGEKTRLLVAHRLAAARFVDRIAVMQQGAVVEYGTHDELMCRRQHYFDMVQRQTVQRKPSCVALQ